MKRRILFRADASGKIGYGHFIRSLALSGYLKNDFECLFASFNSDFSYDIWPQSKYQTREINNVCTPLTVIGHTVDEYNQDFLGEIRCDDIVVLDNYYYSTQYQKAIKDKGCKLVCIDDLHDRHFVCDLLLTPSPLNRDDFSLENYTEFVGGIEWAFLREPFLTFMPKRNISAHIKNIVIAMGGADTFNLTDKIVSVVHDIIPDASINAICGETVSVSSATRKLANIHRCISSVKIVELFDNADIGIFPASTICIEAFSRRLPVIAGYYVNNQEDFYKYGVNKNLFSPIGCLLDDSIAISNRLKRSLKENRPYPVILDFKKQKEKIVELFKAL